MNIKKLAISSFFSLFVLSATVYAEDIYVNSSASAGGNGTQQSPYQTISEAQTAVRAKNDNMTENINVILADGVYNLDAPLEFTAEDSGTNGFNVTYKAAEGANPIITGGKAVTGWALHDSNKNIWRASAKGMTGRQLYVNGQKARRARTEGPSELFSIQSYSSDTLTYTLNADLDGTAPDIMSYTNIGDVELVYNYNWLSQRMGIASKSDADGIYTITMKSGFSDEKFVNTGKKRIVAIENAYELLDTVGEWYSDGTWIYYMPRANENMTTAEVIFPQLERLIDMNGTSDATIENIIFDGIEFKYTTWMSPGTDKGYPGGQGGFGVDIYTEVSGYGTDYAICVSYGRNVIINNCIFDALGCGGIRFADGTRNSKITYSEFYDIANGAIYQYCDNKWFTSGTTPLSNNRIMAYNEITDNVIYDIGTEYESACGIYCAYVCNTTIAHNELSDLPYTGISIGWGWGEVGSAEYYQTNISSINNKIYGNLIHDVMKVLSDGGGIYNLGSQPGMEIYNNVVYNVGASDGAAYYLDNGSRYITMYDNIGYGAVYNLKSKGNDCTIVNNYFDDNKLSQTTSDTVVIDKNTVVSDGVYPKTILENVGVRTGEKRIALKGTIKASAGKNIAVWVKDGETVKYADVITLSDTGEFDITAVGDFEAGKTYTVELSENGSATQEFAENIPTATPRKIYRVYVSVTDDTVAGKLSGKIVGAALNTGDEEMTVIAAIYDSNGRFVDIQTEVIDETCKMSSFSFDAEAGYTIKLFTWKSMEKATPIDTLEIEGI